jgi:Ni/Co efflux regulator RcnB
MVAQSMLDAGVEPVVAEQFIHNDINGAILITLKFEDLKELGIQSFGIRTKIWNQIQALRDSAPASPRAPTPIEDTPSREVKKEKRKEDGLKHTPSRRRIRQPSHEDIISPMESVSIVGIEQVIPKPHHCSKGENCSKYRKQKKLIENFKKEHPFVDIEAEHGGVPETRAMRPQPEP